MAGSPWGSMSMGEVLVIVRSMNGGDASGDVQALGTAISEPCGLGMC